MVKCRKCGVENKDDMKFCVNCGSSLIVSKKTKKKLFLKITAVFTLIVFTSITLSLTIDRLFNGEDENKESEIGPADIPISGTKPFEVRPIQELTISAEANALDKERDFEAYQLKDETVRELAESVPYKDRIIIDAYEVNAGLKEDEFFPGQIKLSFDLEEMDIPKSLYPYLTLMRIGEDGVYQELDTTIEGSTLVCFTNKNSVIVTSLLLSGLAATMGYYVYDDLGEKYLWKFPELRDKRVYSTRAIDHYSIFWLEGMKPANPDLVKSKTDQFNKIFKKYKIPTDKGFAEDIFESELMKNDEYRKAIKLVLGNVFSDEEFIKTLKEVSSDEWQRKNLWPLEVKLSVESIEEADKYLFEKRKFRRPSHTVEIGLLPKWPYESKLIYGFSNNPTLASPYIHINLDDGKVPWLKRQLENPNLRDKYQENIDELYLTVVHELFHIVQNGYVPVDSNRDLWFWEATAVTLENEANKYYLDEKIILTKNLGTETNKYETLSNTLGGLIHTRRMKGDQYAIRNQAYTSSSFLEYLRDLYYSQNKDEFLEKLLTRYTSNRDGVRSLIRQTSNSRKVFESDYRLFSRKNVEKFYKRFLYVVDRKKSDFYPLLEGSKYPLTERNPIVKIDVDYEPLSTMIKYIHLNYDKDKYKDVTVIVERGEDDLLKSNNVYLTIDKDGGKGFEFIGSDGYYIAENFSGKEFNKPSLNIQEIHSYYKIGGNNKDKFYKAYLMLEPEPPKLEKRDDKLIVKLPEKSKLFKDGFAKKYLLVVHGPKGKPIFIETDKDEEEIELNSSGDFIAWDDSKTVKQINEAARNYISSNPELKKEITDQLGKKGLESFIESAGELDIDYGALGRAAEILSGVGGELEYKASVCEIVEAPDYFYGPVSDFEVLKEDVETTADVDIYGDWEGKVQITNQEVTITISQGKEGYDYTLTNSMYEDEINGGLMEFYGKDNNDGTVSFGENTGFEFSLIKNSEKELYMTAPPTTLKRK